MCGLERRQDALGAGQRAAKRAADEQARAERERRWSDMARDDELRSLQAELAETRAALASEPWKDLPRKVTVLFLTAEPEGIEHLRVDEVPQIVSRERLERPIRVAVFPGLEAGANDWRRSSGIAAKGRSSFRI